jgi:MoaA/NifB/PqqE/SkfB family radical SAM enzyme
VAGTVCNLACTHCFVSCGPGEDRHALMDRDHVRRRVREALALGAKEFYFTGGEPFLHPEILEILEDTLACGPTTVLTNGTLFTSGRLRRLAALSRGSRYSLELRVSLDGWRADEHDRFRGPGAFERALTGIAAAARAGLLPIVTATQFDDEDPLVFRERYVEMLRQAGVERPRLKVLPRFRLGREAHRSRPYDESETLSGLPSEAFDVNRLQCGSGRAVTARGVWVCPLLVDEPSARMADRLVDALGSFPLHHGACFTCYVTGMTCGND